MTVLRQIFFARSLKKKKKRGEKKRSLVLVSRARRDQVARERYVSARETERKRDSPPGGVL